MNVAVQQQAGWRAGAACWTGFRIWLRSLAADAHSPASSSTPVHGIACTYFYINEVFGVVMNLLISSVCVTYGIFHGGDAIIRAVTNCIILRETCPVNI